MGYVTAATLKQTLGITDTARDTYITASVDAASERIDEHCHRTFSLSDTASQRIFRATAPAIDDDDQDGQRLYLGADIGSSTGLIVEVGTSAGWTAITTDIELHPLDAAAKNRPWTSLLYIGGGWPVGGGQRVRVTAKWGWPSIPKSVALATQIMAIRLYKRKDSAEGAVGSADWGMFRIPKIDPDVEQMLVPFVLPVG